MLKRKLIIAAVYAVILVAIAASSGIAQIARFGYVDSDKVFLDFKEWGRAQEEFNAAYKAWEDEAREQQKEYEELFEEYEKQKLILSAKKKTERQAALDAKRQALDAFTREIFGPGGVAERKNNTLVKPLLDRINASIEKVATEENFDFIFNSSGLAYAKKDYDITDKVVEALENE